MRDFFLYLLGVVTILLGTIGPALAEVPDEFTVDVASMETLAGMVLSALAVLWCIRKLIKTTNRS